MKIKFALTRLILLILIILFPAWGWGATYYMRADGTVAAADKANATSCSAAASAMNVTQHNAATFSAGDTITLCDTGGVFRDAVLTPPSSGSAGSVITYNNSGTPVVSGADLISTWTAEPGTVTYGDSGASTRSDTRYNDYIYYFPIAVSTGGTVQKMVFGLGASVPTAMKCAIYTDNAGAPNTLVTNSATDNNTSLSANAFNEFVWTGTKPVLTAGNYHMAVWASVSTYAAATGGAGVTVIYDSQAYGAWPATPANNGTFTLSTSTTDFYMILDTGAANLYYATYATAPNTLTYNRTWGVKKANKVDMSATGHWWVDVPNTRIYLYTTAGDPDTVYTNPGVEAGVRTKALDHVGTIDYVTYRNINFYHGNDTTAGVSTAQVAYGAEHVTFDTCTFKYGGWTGLFFSSTDGLIDNCDASYNAGHGYDIDSANSTTIEDSTATYNLSQGIFFGAIHAPMTNVIGQRLTSHHNSNGIKIDGSDDLIIRDSTIYSNVNNGITSDGDVDGVIVTRNIIHDNAAGAAGIDFTTNPYGAITDFNIYYNIIYNEGTGVYVAGGSGDINLYNNVFYNMSVATFVFDDANSIGTFKNNISHTSPTHINIVADVDQTITSDYNLYYPVTGTRFNWKGTAKNLADWQTASSQDAHSIVTDPLFVSTSDFNLQATSPAINAGTVITTTATTDYEGNSLKGAVDIGAYEYQDGNIYVDQTSGSDSANGLTGTPWKTIAKVNGAGLVPDANVYFKKGETWREQLTVPSSGSSGHPITFGSYGTGAAPIINGADIVTPGTSWAAATTAGSELISYTTGSDVHGVNAVAAQVWLAWSFVAPSSSTVGSVILKLNQVGTVAEGKVVWVEIYSDSSGPSSRITNGLSDTIVASTITTNLAGAEYTFTFSTPPSITNATTYWIVIKSDYETSLTNYIGIWSHDAAGNAASAGKKWNGTDTWANVTYDFYYKVNSASTPVTNGWQSTATTEPSVVTMNGTLGTHKASVATLASEYDWFWESNVLYIYSPADPDTRYTSPGVEIGQRNNAILTNTKDYLIIDGLTVKGANNYGININGASDHITVQNCTATQIYYNGIGFYQNTGSGSNLIDSNTIYNNMRDGIGSLTMTGGWDAGTRTVISNNQVYNNGAYGIYVHSGFWTIERNNVYNNCLIVAACNGIEIYADEGDADGMGSNNIIRYNTVYDTNNSGGTDDGVGIIIDQWCTNNEVYYNRLYNNDGPGIALYNAGNASNGTNYVYNNVAYGNSQGAGTSTKCEYKLASSAADLTTNAVLKNNIGRATVADGYAIYVDAFTYDNTLSITNNLWYSAATNWYFWNNAGGNTLATWNGLTGVGTDLNSDPLFISTSDFRLRGNSPAKNAGVDVSLTTDYAGFSVPYPPGGAVDMGAYEYRGGGGGSSLMLLGVSK